MQILHGCRIKNINKKEGWGSFEVMAASSSVLTVGTQERPFHGAVHVSPMTRLPAQQRHTLLGVRRVDRLGRPPEPQRGLGLVRPLPGVSAEADVDVLAFGDPLHRLVLGMVPQAGQVCVMLPAEILSGHPFGLLWNQDVPIRSLFGS